MLNSGIPFAPTIYEHSAACIGKTPSQVAADGTLLTEALLAAYERYLPDRLAVGFDVYNLEPEALGAEILYYEENSDSLPACVLPLIHAPGDLERLRLPDPRKSGRMPFLLEACKQLLARAKGRETVVGGALTGPFTLAAILRGFEAFVVDMLEEPDFALRQLAFAEEVSFRLGSAYHSLGAGLVVNESWVAPPLCSPGLYREFGVPAETRLIRRLREIGARDISLISGGNTTPIVGDMLETVPSLIMADWGCDLKYFAALCREKNVLLRASVPSAAVERGDREEMTGMVDSILRSCGGYEGLLIGCGIVSYTTKPEHVLLFRDIVRNACV